VLRFLQIIVSFANELLFKQQKSVATADKYHELL